MRAAEDVQRQIAIAIIVTVKEPTLLMPVQRVVGGIEVEDDLLRRMLVRLHEQIDKQRLDPGAVPGDPVIARQLRPAPPRSSRLSVDLPASGAQFLRRADSLPASTAMVGSWRSSSWSIRSS